MLKHPCMTVIAISFAIACVGEIGGRSSNAAGSEGREPPDLVGGNSDDCAGREESTAPSPLRRLTQAQYRNTVKALLGVDALPASVVGRLNDLPDGNEAGFAANVGAPETETLRGYLDMAFEIAPLVSIDCDPSLADCARQIVGDLGRRAFRRPLDPTEIDDFVGVYETLRGTDGDEPALQTALAGILSSPSFLYHAERVIGPPQGTTVALDAYALANRLSYFLWNSAPDATLSEAAASGALQDVGTLEAEARRLMADARFAENLRSFYGQWLHAEEVSGLSRSDPAWTDALQRSLVEESHRFVAAVMNDDARLATLLAAPYTYGDSVLAEHYGAQSPDADGRIDLPPERAGILTQAAPLAALGTVFPEVHRGAWVRNNLLCDPAPPPPADLDLDSGVNRLETQPCATCHRGMDPIGFGFAAFDSLGRHDASAAAGAPVGEIIDSSGSLEPGLAGEFGSVRELADRLGASDRVHGCFAIQWFRYANQRREEADDTCAVLNVRDGFIGQGGDVRELMLAIVRATPFRTRSTSELVEGGES